MQLLVKREEASDLVLTIFVTGLTSLLVTRLFLEITNYYQMGHGEWHLAHVLWGGIGMVIGGLLPFCFHGGKIRKTAAIFFGAGFGMFIDEIGKFITRDNNYFFQPAIIFMYVAFVLLFIIYYFLQRINPKDPRSLMYQIIGQLEEVAENDLDIKEKEKMLINLKQLQDRAPNEVVIFSQRLEQLVKDLPTTPNKKPGLWLVIYKKIRSFGYNKIFKRKFMLIVLLLLAGVQVVLSFGDFFQMIWTMKNGQGVIINVQNMINYPRFNSWMMVSKITADMVAGLFYLVGMVLIWRKRSKSGLLFFQTGLLISIFLSAFFKFYFEQFSAIVNLFFNITVLLGVQRMRRDLEIAKNRRV